MIHTSLLPLALLTALASAQGNNLPACPDSTGSATIIWPSSLYARGKTVTLAPIQTQDSTTTYTGIECLGNPHSMTVAAGPGTFSWERYGGSIGTTEYAVVQECSGDEEQMVCTETARSPGTYSTVMTLGEEDIYDVTVALAEGGDFTPGTPTMELPAYTGCPEDWAMDCGNGWCCPENHICTTISVAGYEACATGTNDAFPGPALPFMTAGMPGSGPGPETGSPSTGGMPGVPRPTGGAEMLVGGLVGLAAVLL